MFLVVSSDLYPQPTQLSTLLCTKGIHNVFVVIPQFIVTGISAIVFAIFEPGLSVLPAHGSNSPGSSSNSTIVDVASLAADSVSEDTSRQGFDSIGFMFRLVLFTFKDRPSVLGSVDR